MKEEQTIFIEIMQNYTIVLELVNILVLIINAVLLFFQKKRKWCDYIICLYGGFLFGMIPLFVVSGSTLAAGLGCILLTAAFIHLHNKLETRIYIPLLIIIFKILLVIGITIFEEQYSLHMFGFYLVLMFVSVFVFGIINLLHELSVRQQLGLIKLFALLEISGGVIQLYKNDLISFGKDLFDRKESVSLFLYLLRVDFGIFDYQYLYIICFLFVLFIYIVLKIILNNIQKRENC